MPDSSKRVWSVLFAVLLGHVMLVALPTEVRQRSGIVRTIVLDSVTPLERIVDIAVGGVASVWSNYFDLLDVRRDNERLRAELAELRIKVNGNRADLSEAARLREFMDLEPQVNGERVAARVIGRDTTLSRQTITIDRGLRSGLHANAVVITPDGVVGRVIHAAYFSSLVQLVSDPESAVGVIVDASRVQGVVRGWDRGSMRLEHVDASDELQVGDLLITSGTDQIYPKGLPVGAVASLGRVEDLMKTAVVSPAAELGRLEEVLCLINVTDSTRLIDVLPEAPRNR